MCIFARTNTNIMARLFGGNNRILISNKLYNNFDPGLQVWVIIPGKTENDMVYEVWDSEPNEPYELIYCGTVEDIYN